jgi:hypothetical protein
MNLIEANRMIFDLMAEHNVHAQVEWNNARGQAGVCRQKGGRMYLVFARPAFRLMSEEEARDVILHEMAHAICGVSAGHGPVWRATHIRMGGNGERCFSNVEIGKAVAKWQAECRVSRKVIGYRNRLTQSLRDATCSCHGRPALWIDKG